MSPLDYVIVLLYFGVMIGAGYWGLTRARSADDHLVAGRRLGPFMYVGCLSERWSGWRKATRCRRHDQRHKSYPERV